MEMYQDGVRVMVLPDGAQCKRDENNSSPLDLDVCPIGKEFCDGNCFYYEEN